MFNVNSATTYERLADPRMRAGRGQNAPMDNRRVSTCKVCWLGVYRGQAYAFYQASDVLLVPGFSHDDCVRGLTAPAPRS